MMEFWTSLILVDENQLPEQQEELKLNCTFVKNRIWIFEGDVDFLDAKFTVLSEGAVPPLGGLSESKLVQICKDTFVFDHSLLQPEPETEMSKKGSNPTAEEVGAVKPDAPPGPPNKNRPGGVYNHASLVAIFAEWKRQYEDDPSAHSVDIEDSEFAEDSALYFQKIADEIS